MRLSDLIPVPLNPKKLAEYYDNPPLLFYAVGALIWGLISILLSASTGNIFNISITMLFMVLIFGSLSTLDFLIDKFHIDFREGFKLMNLIFIPLGVMLIFVVIIFVSAISGMNVSSLWWTFSFQLGEPTTTVAPLVEVHLRFVGFSNMIGIDPNLLYNILQTVFLVAPGEELVFRGVLTYCFGILANAVWTGGIIATFIWAFIHTICAYTAGNVLGMLFIAMFGGIIMLAFMIYTQDISTSVGIHGLYNVLTIIMSSMGV